MLIVLSTCPNLAEAESLSSKIVDRRLAACVQIMPPMTSIYLWDGEVQKETEHLLLIKTLPEKWDELLGFISGEHSYAVPEIVAIESSLVSEPYLSWMRETLGA